MISAPGFSLPAFPVWDSIYVCAQTCTWVYVCPWCVALMFICSIFPCGWERSVEKWKHHFLRHMIFFSFFLAVSGLVFTGCFICLIYVPCPDCCMSPACSSHMAVPHALMRCPISRNTNRVLRPSLWLYDVWTHKSFPETPDQGGSKPGKGPFCILERGVVFSHLTHSWAIYQKRGCKTEGTGTFFNLFVFFWFSVLFPGRKFYC